MKKFLTLFVFALATSDCFSAELPVVNFGLEGVDFELTGKGLEVVVVNKQVSITGKLRTLPGDKWVKMDDMNAVEGVVVGDGGKISRHFQFSYKKTKADKNKNIVFDKANGFIDLLGSVDASYMPIGNYCVEVYLIRAQVGGSKKTFSVPSSRIMKFSTTFELK